MLIYFLVLLAPLLLAMLRWRNPQGASPGLWLYFVVLLLFCGFRVEVGPDWTGYQNIYDIAADSNLDDLLANPEAGFFLLNRMSEELGFGYAGVIFMASLIFLFGCFKYARRTPNAWLAIAVVTPYLIFIVSMSGIRQACAIGIGFLMLAKWERSSRLKKFALIALATSFHNSAAALLFFVIFDLNVRLLAKVAMAVAVTALILYASSGAETLERYRSVYLDENLISEGALFHLLLTAFPAALYLAFRKRLASAGLVDQNVFVASVLALLAVPLLAISSTGVDRLTLYFSFVQMWTYPSLVRAGVLNLSVAKAAVSALVLMIFFVYFLFGSHASLYLPYRNLIF